jgi:membrane protein required for colicin V production
MSLGFTAVDILAVVVVVLSTIYAVYRGFVSETLTIVGLLAAVFAALYFGPWAAPLFRGLVSATWLAEFAGYSLIFLVVLIPVSFASHRIAANVDDSALGPIDRILGFAFGVARGFVVVSLAYIIFTWMVPIAHQPDVVRKARLLPLIQNSAEVLIALAPHHHDHSGFAKDASAPEANTSAMPKEAAASPAAPAQVVKVKAVSQVPHKHRAKAYGAKDRRALDKLIEASGSVSGAKP